MSTTVSSVDQRDFPYRRDDRRPLPLVNRKEDRGSSTSSDWHKESFEKRPDSSGLRRGPGDDRRRMDDRGRGDRNVGPRENRCE